MNDDFRLKIDGLTPAFSNQPSALSHRTLIGEPFIED